MADYFDILLAKKLAGGTPASLQTKSVTITENGDTTVTADEGYDGLEQVNVTTNVSGGGIPEVPDDALLFWAMYPFSLETYNKTKNWDGKILYSSDYSTWVEWDGASKISSAANGGFEKLYLRGVGNTKVGGNSPQYRWVINGFAHCCGNLDNLLDYSASVSMAQYAFGHLFYQAQGVDFDCSLPSLVAPDGAYYAMFRGSSITCPPKIMATTMGVSCCETMFRDCIALICLPAISASSLSLYSLVETFRGCTKIKLSTTQSDEYINEFRIPITGTGSDNNSLNSMFTGTGGSFAGTPTINTTYYTSNTVVSPT